MLDGIRRSVALRNEKGRQKGTRPPQTRPAVHGNALCRGKRACNRFDAVVQLSLAWRREVPYGQVDLPNARCPKRV